MTKTERYNASIQKLDACCERNGGCERCHPDKRQRCIQRWEFWSYHPPVKDITGRADAMSYATADLEPYEMPIHDEVNYLIGFQMKAGAL